MDNPQKWTKSEIKKFAHSLVNAGTIPKTVQSNYYCPQGKLYVSFNHYLICSVADEDLALKVLKQVEKITNSPLWKVLND